MALPCLGWSVHEEFTCRRLVRRDRARTRRGAGTTTLAVLPDEGTDPGPQLSHGHRSRGGGRLGRRSRTDDPSTICSRRTSSVKIDGTTRRVVSADLVKVDVEAARKPQVDKTQDFYTSNLTPPNGRRIVLAIDQVRIGPGTLRPVLDAASRFIDRLTPLIRSPSSPSRNPACVWTSPTTKCAFAARCSASSGTRSDPRRDVTASRVARHWRSGETRRFVYTEVVERECRASRERARERSVPPGNQQGIHGGDPEARDDAERSRAGWNNCSGSWRRSRAPS